MRVRIGLRVTGGASRIRFFGMLLLVAVSAVVPSCGGYGLSVESATIGATPLGAQLLDELPGSQDSVLLNFYSSTCNPCRAEIPLLKDYAANAVGVDVVGVSLDVTAEQREAFNEEMGIDYATIVDNDNRFSDAIALSLLPTTILVDRASGEVYYSEVGLLDDMTDIDEALRAHS